MNSRRGFTIVELLIVIIVIAVLATITIVAYNGVRARAINSEKAAKANRIQKALEMYATDHGQYPTNTQLGGTGAVGAKLLGLSLSDFEPTGYTYPGYGIEANGWANASSTGFVYQAYQYKNWAGFACGDGSTPNNCQSYVLTYWNYLTNSQVSVSGTI